jgi:hypothetical protein
MTLLSLNINGSHLFTTTQNRKYLTEMSSHHKAYCFIIGIGDNQIVWLRKYNSSTAAYGIENATRKPNKRISL